MANGVSPTGSLATAPALAFAHPSAYPDFREPNNSKPENWKGLAAGVIVTKPTPDVLPLQQELIDAVTPYTENTTARANADGDVLVEILAAGSGSVVGHQWVDVRFSLSGVERRRRRSPGANTSSPTSCSATR